MDIEHSIAKLPEQATPKALLDDAPLIGDHVDFDQFLGSDAETLKTPEPELHFAAPISTAVSALGLNFAETINRPAALSQTPPTDVPNDNGSLYFGSASGVENRATPLAPSDDYARPLPGHQNFRAKVPAETPTVDKSDLVPNVKVDGGALSTAITAAKNPQEVIVGKPKPVTEMQQFKKSLRPDNKSGGMVTTEVRTEEIHKPAPQHIKNGVGSETAIPDTDPKAEIVHPPNHQSISVHRYPDPEVRSGLHHHPDVPRPKNGVVPEHPAGPRVPQISGNALPPGPVLASETAAPVAVSVEQPETLVASKIPKVLAQPHVLETKMQAAPDDIASADKMQGHTRPVAPQLVPPVLPGSALPPAVPYLVFEPPVKNSPTRPMKSGEHIGISNGSGKVHDVISAAQPPAMQVTIPFNPNGNADLLLQSPRDPARQFDVTFFEPASSQSTAPASGANTPPTATDYSPRIIQMIVESARALVDKPVELTLSPEELGKVKLTLQSGEGSMTVAISAERSETLELLRRNIDQLAAQFREIGYQDLSFQFSGQGDPNKGQLFSDGSGTPDQSNAEEPELAGSHDVHRLNLQADGRVDIRL